MGTSDRFGRASSGRWATDGVIKRERTVPAAGKDPAQGLRVDVGRATDTSTELRVSCACGRHAVVVCDHPAPERGA